MRCARSPLTLRINRPRNASLLFVLAVALRSARSSRLAAKGRVLPAIALLASLIAAGCGTRVHEHVLEVVVRDPSGRLGTPPHEVGVFDWRMGRSAEWARKTAGTAGVRPYRTTFSTVDTVSIGVARPEKVELALWLPGLEREGFYPLRVEPKARPAGNATLRPVRFDESPADGTARWLAVRWTTAPMERGWRLELDLEVPADAERGKDG